MNLHCPMWVFWYEVWTHLPINYAVNMGSSPGPGSSTHKKYGWGGCLFLGHPPPIPSRSLFLHHTVGGQGWIPHTMPWSCAPFSMGRPPQIILGLVVYYDWCGQWTFQHIPPLRIPLSIPLVVCLVWGYPDKGVRIDFPWGV